MSFTGRGVNPTPIEVGCMEGSLRERSRVAWAVVMRTRAPGCPRAIHVGRDKECLQTNGASRFPTSTGRFGMHDWDPPLLRTKTILSMGTEKWLALPVARTRDRRGWNINF